VPELPPRLPQAPPVLPRPGQSAPIPRPAPVVQSPAVVSSSQPTARRPESAPGAPGGIKPPPGPPPPTMPPRKKPGFDWEGLVGVKLFSWIAGIALALAGVFFLRYSLEAGWLPAPVRLADGLGAGLRLW